MREISRLGGKKTKDPIVKYSTHLDPIFEGVWAKTLKEDLSSSPGLQKLRGLGTPLPFPLNNSVLEWEKVCLFFVEPPSRLAIKTLVSKDSIALSRDFQKIQTKHNLSVGNRASIKTQPCK